MQLTVTVWSQCVSPIVEWLTFLVSGSRDKTNRTKKISKIKNSKHPSEQYITHPMGLYQCISNRMKAAGRWWRDRCRSDRMSVGWRWLDRLKLRLRSPLPHRPGGKKRRETVRNLETCRDSRKGILRNYDVAFKTMVSSCFRIAMALLCPPHWSLDPSWVSAQPL